MWDNHSSASYWLVSNVNQPNEVKSFTAAHSVHNSDQCNDVTMVSAWSRVLPRHCDTTLGCDQFVQAPVSSCWLTHTHTYNTSVNHYTTHTPCTTAHQTVYCWQPCLSGCCSSSMERPARGRHLIVITAVIPASTKDSSFSTIVSTPDSLTTYQASLQWSL